MLRDPLNHGQKHTFHACTITMSYDSDNARWEAYQFSDPFATDAFVCLNLLTRTVCRPNCDLGRKGETKQDVVFFGSIAALKSSTATGYTFCKHCDPSHPETALNLDLIRTTIHHVNQTIGFTRVSNELKRRAYSNAGFGSGCRSGVPVCAPGETSHTTFRELSRNESEHFKLVELACRHIGAAAIDNFTKQQASLIRSSGSSSTEDVTKKKKRGGVLGFKELAIKSKLSAWHFHRVFKSVTGLTPKSYGDKCWEYVKSREKPQTLRQQQSRGNGISASGNISNNNTVPATSIHKSINRASFPENGNSNGNRNGDGHVAVQPPPSSGVSDSVTWTTTRSPIMRKKRKISSVASAGASASANANASASASSNVGTGADTGSGGLSSKSRDPIDDIPVNCRNLSTFSDSSISSHSSNDSNFSYVTEASLNSNSDNSAPAFTPSYSDYSCYVTGYQSLLSGPVQDLNKNSLNIHASAPPVADSKPHTIDLGVLYDEPADNAEPKINVEPSSSSPTPLTPELKLSLSPDLTALSSELTPGQVTVGNNCVDVTYPQFAQPQLNQAQLHQPQLHQAQLSQPKLHQPQLREPSSPSCQPELSLNVKDLKNCQSTYTPAGAEKPRVSSRASVQAHHSNIMGQQQQLRKSSVLDHQYGTGDTRIYLGSPQLSNDETGQGVSFTGSFVQSHPDSGIAGVNNTLYHITQDALSCDPSLEPRTMVQSDDNGVMWPNLQAATPALPGKFDRGTFQERTPNSIVSYQDPLVDDLYDNLTVPVTTPDNDLVHSNNFFVDYYKAGDTVSASELLGHHQEIVGDGSCPVDQLLFHNFTDDDNEQGTFDTPIFNY